MKRSKLEIIKAMMHKAAVSLADDDALKAVELFPAWEADTVYDLGVRVRYGDKLYRCEQAHTSQSGWAADGKRVLRGVPGHDTGSGVTRHKLRRLSF